MADHPEIISAFFLSLNIINLFFWLFFSCFLEWSNRTS